MSRVIQQLTTHQDIISTTALPSLSYPIKRLTYSEMQQLRDQGLCLNCNSIDSSSHRCSVKRIVLVLPDEDPNTEHQPIETAAPKQLSSQDISFSALNHASDLKAPQSQSDGLNSSAAMQINMGITHHQLHTKSARTLDFQIGKSFFLSISAENEENIMRKIFCCKNSSWHIKLKEDDAHNKFAEMNRLEWEWTAAPTVFVEMHILKCESKVFIFDPGGMFNLECTFDLEDKVVFKRSVMIRYKVAPANSTRPKRVVCLSRRFLE